MTDGDRGRATGNGAPNLRRRRSNLGADPWTPAPASFLPNRGYREPGRAGGRRFAPTEHLAPEAVAAFVDGELGMSAHARASHHLALCPECVSAVEAQSLARTRLRESGQVSVPASLLGQLSQIPTREIHLGPDAPTDGIPNARNPLNGRNPLMRATTNPFARDARGRNIRRRGR